MAGTRRTELAFSVLVLMCCATAVMGGGRPQTLVRIGAQAPVPNPPPATRPAPPVPSTPPATPSTPPAPAIPSPAVPSTPPPPTSVHPSPTTPPSLPQPEQPKTWCVANPATDPAALQQALDYACGVNPSFCQAIQPGQSCFEPNTLPAHASFAFNSYWRALESQGGNCDFAGNAVISIRDPSYAGCKYA